MDHRDEKTPPTDQQTDLSKARSAQQPQAGHQGQPPEGQAPQQPPAGQTDFGTSGQDNDQSDTIAQQRSDIEAGTATGQASDVEDSSPFVGAEGASDTSSELIEDDDDDFAKDRRGDGE